MLRRSALLSIAGFDPSLGAGIFQDATTFERHGFHALAVPAVLVAEDSHQVKSSQPLAKKLLLQMLQLLNADFDIVGVKLGLLPSSAAALNLIIKFLADLKAKRRIPIVWDPVMATSAGQSLVEIKLIKKNLSRIIAAVDLITPNLLEFQQLAGANSTKIGPIRDERALNNQLKTFYRRYPLNVLVTGTRFEPRIITDWLFTGDELKPIISPRLALDAHGTGCRHSSLILVALAQGKSLAEAATWAKHEMQRTLATPTRPAKSLRPFLSLEID